MDALAAVTVGLRHATELAEEGGGKNLGDPLFCAVILGGATVSGSLAVTAIPASRGVSFVIVLGLSVNSSSSRQSDIIGDLKNNPYKQQLS